MRVIPLVDGGNPTDGMIEFRYQKNAGGFMEKKTIGKFISALRRANGMTQKELGFALCLCITKAKLAIKTER